MPARDEPNYSVLQPFIRYKQHIDSTFASAFDNMFGSSGFHPRRADSTDWHNVPQPLSSQIRSLFWSPYNPTQLRSLPQPVPSDLPQGAEPILTFEDAFEDLLAVSQGQPLPEIQQKLSQRRLLNQVFPRGEPPTFWMRRLDAQGLIPPLNRNDDERRDTRELQRMPPEPKPEDWDRLHSELARRREETWDSEARNVSRPENIPDLRGLFKHGFEAIRSNPELEKHLNEIAQSIGNDILGRGQDPRREDSQSNKIDALQSETGDKNQTPTFDDLVEHVQKFQTEASSSWDAFTRSLESGREIIESLAGHPKDGGRQFPRELDENGPRSIEEGKPQHESSTVCSSTTREVDRNGKIVVRTSWKKLDGKGNVIDSSEDLQVYDPSEKSTRVPGHEDKNEHHRGYPADSGEVKKPGWFWK